MQSIISWNVLFRKYEEEYYPNSKILEKYPNENERVTKIVAFLKENSNAQTVLCLQECSTQVLDSLVTIFKSTHFVYSYNIRDNEHLVTITPKEFQMVWSGPHNTTNGYLIVYNGLYHIVNCHLLPQRYAKSSVMKRLREFGEEYGIVFIAGDFNETHRNVKERLWMKYSCPYYGKTYKHKAIDQIVFNLDMVYETSIIKQEYISDHHAISLKFVL
jgi:hypothetical protein